MRKFAIGFVFLAIGAACFIGFEGVTARNLSIAEKFANTGVAPESGTYNFDKNHSAIGFKVKHMGLVYVPGYFTDFTGSVNYNADDVTKSSVTFSAKTASVNTRVAGQRPPFAKRRFL